MTYELYIPLKFELSEYVNNTIVFNTLYNIRNVLRAHK